MKHLREWLYFLAVSVAPGLIYQFIQDDLRDRAADAGDFAGYLMGIAPNFLGALSVSGVLFIFGLDRFKSASRTSLVFGAAAVSMLGLWTWELVQLAIPKASFDWHDVGWTMMGGALFLIITRIWFANVWRTRDKA